MPAGINRGKNRLLPPAGINLPTLCAGLCHHFCTFTWQTSLRRRPPSGRASLPWSFSSKKPPGCHPSTGGSSPPVSRSGRKIWLLCPGHGRRRRVAGSSSCPETGNTPCDCARWAGSSRLGTWPSPAASSRRGRGWSRTGPVPACR